MSTQAALFFLRVLHRVPTLQSNRQSDYAGHACAILIKKEPGRTEKRGHCRTDFCRKEVIYTSLTGNTVNEVESAMTKPVSLAYCRQTRDDLDQALKGMRDALRKPLKPTATLKRRALKKKFTGKPAIVIWPGNRSRSVGADSEVEGVVLEPIEPR